MKISHVLAVICLLVNTSVAFGETYHVARGEPTASDENDGLAAKKTDSAHGPWKTLVKAAETVVAGDTVLVYDGDYRTEKSGWGTGRIAIKHSGTSAAEPIQFCAASNQHPVLGTVLVYERQWITLRGLTFENPVDAYPDNWVTMPATVVDDPSVKIDPKEPWSTREKKIQQKYTTFTSIVKQFHTVYSNGIDIKKSSHVRVHDCVLSGYSFGIQIREQSRDVVIEGNDISRCSEGIFTWQPTPSLSGGVFRKNRIHHNLNNGIDLREDAENVLIEDNHLRHNGISHITLIHGTRNCTVRHNDARHGGYYSETMRNPGSSAINVHSSRTGIVVEGNFAAYQIDLTGNDGNGYIADWMKDGAGVLYRNNVAYRNMGAGFNSTESPNNIYVNNTMVENGYHAVNPRSGAGIKFSRESAASQTAINNIFFNNAVAGIKADGTIDRQTLIDSNLYFSDSNAPLIWDAYQFDRQDFRTLETVRENTRWERNGRVGDPLFRDPEKGDFRLTAGSPAIDAGQATTSVTNDFRGTSRPPGKKPDMGAYEYSR